MKPYTKPWLPLAKQIQILEKRGLIIQDHSEAAHFLGHLNYYRFTGYGLAFERERDRYFVGTTFEDIRQTYEFDRALRDLFTESAAVIELDLRTTVAATFSEAHGPFGHVRPEKFHPNFNHPKHPEWLKKLHSETQRSKEPFIAHFKNNYCEFPDLPLWVATEVMSFGALSQMIGGMLKGDQKRVAARYGFQPDVLVSCAHHLTYVRNLCAHHARLWDRVFAIKSTLPAGKSWCPPLLPDNQRVYSSLLLQAALLKHVTAERRLVADWKQRVEQLIADHLPACPDALAKMGMPPNWHEHPIWH